MSNLKDQLWVAKYAPNDFSETIMPDSMKEKISKTDLCWSNIALAMWDFLLFPKCYSNPSNLQINICLLSPKPETTLLFLVFY